MFHFEVFAFLQPSLIAVWGSFSWLNWLERGGVVADKVRVWLEPVLWPKNDRKTNEQNDKMKCINVNLSAGSPRMVKMEVEMEFEMGWRSFGWTCNIALDDDFSVSPATINFSIFLCSRLLLLIVLSAHFTHSLRNTTAHLPGA